jgi:polygalacturonase
MFKVFIALCLAAVVSSQMTTTLPRSSLRQNASGCDVTQFGAVGDNNTEATSSFNAAIAACQKRSAVIVPPGAYLIRPIELLSHTTLIIKPGAVLVAWAGVGWQNGWPNSTTRTCKASPYQAEQPIVLPELESLLYGDAVNNVTVKGGGTIDGQGWRWWPLRGKSEYWHHCRCRNPLCISEWLSVPCI